MDPIPAALVAVVALKSGENLVYTKIAGEYGVDQRTLATPAHFFVAQHQGSKSTMSPPTTGVKLIRYIELLTERDLPPRRAMIRNFASQNCER